MNSAPDRKSDKSELTYSRSSHSLSSALMKRVRSLAYRKHTSESAIIECALWFFFKNVDDADLLEALGRAGIARRRRSSARGGPRHRAKATT